MFHLWPAIPASRLMRPAPATVVCLLLWAAAFLMPVHPEIVPGFTNQWPMVLGWGLALCTALPGLRLPRSPQVWCVAAVGLALAALASLRQPLAACVLASATAVFLFGAAEQETDWSTWVLVVLLAAGLLSLPLAALQVWSDPATRADWIPVNHKAIGRAVGFLGQPNLLCTLLAWSLAALVGLAALRNWRGYAIQAAALGLGLGMELTNSRTGLLELAVIGLWVWRSPGLGRNARQLILLAAAGWLLGLGLSWLAAQLGHGVFFQDVRAKGHSDASGSRFPVWRDTLALIREHPLTGVGWGNFNFAWSLSEMPQRHPAQFDHTHNILLQFAVELGIPAALLILAVAGWALAGTRGALRTDPGVPRGDTLLAQTAGVLLAIIGVHSMLEYPLWYAFFLLPSAWWLGVLLRLGARRARPTAPAPAGRPLAGPLLQAAGVVIVLGSLFAAWDFMRVLRIYQVVAGVQAAPLEARIEAGRRSVLFGALADYAVVVTAAHPEQVMEVFDRPMHYLVDTHLLMAYAKAYAARGELDKARYLVARIREFRHPAAAGFLDICDQPVSPRPFQCESSPAHFGYRDFLSPTTIRPAQR